MPHTELSLRAITTDDALCIASLWRVCTAEVAQHDAQFAPVLSDEIWAEKLSSALEQQQRFGWLLHNDTQIAAYVLCQWQQGSPFFAPQLSLYISDLDVAPAFRGRRLTYQLMQCVEHYAREHQVFRVELSVALADPRPQQVWAKHGFTPYLANLAKYLGS